MIRVRAVMTPTVFTCHMEDPVNAAAQLMWDHDCGCIPVIDEHARVVGILTDRDVCMAAYTQGKTLHEMNVGNVCSRNVVICHEHESIADAEQTMMKAQVRRLPIVDHLGALVGIVSLGDLAQHARDVRVRDRSSTMPRNVAALLEAVSRPRAPEDNAGTR